METRKNQKDLESVLIVDDNSDILEFTAFVLKLYGNMNVSTAKTGLGALAILDIHTPDLILLDLKMPVLGGYETLIRMKHEPETAKIPVIIMTCLTDKKYLERLRDFGVTSYILKPFNPETLVEEIKEKWRNEINTF